MSTQWPSSDGRAQQVGDGGPDVQRLFALAWLEDRLPFFDALDEALAGT